MYRYKPTLDVVPQMPVDIFQFRIHYWKTKKGFDKQNIPSKFLKFLKLSFNGESVLSFISSAMLQTFNSDLQFHKIGQITELPPFLSISTISVASSIPSSI